MLTSHLFANHYGAAVPGLLRYTTDGQLELKWESEGRQQNLNIHYKGTAVPTGGGFTSPAGLRPETLAFRESDKGSAMWELKNGSVLVRKERTNTLPWTPAGLSQMTEDLYGKKISPEDEALVASFYDNIAAQQGFPPKAVPTSIFRNVSFSSSSQNRGSYTPMASALIAIATACLFGCAIHFTAKATMGGGTSGE